MDMQLATSSSSPLYQQMIEDLKDDIISGAYATGDKIPSELELANSYNVSRITVRRAISELCDEGYLIKRQGKGTFVTPPKIQRKITQDQNVLSFTATCAMSGIRAGAEMLEAKKCLSRQDEQTILHLEDGSNVVYIQRVRTADGAPVMLENNFFPSPEFDNLLNENLNDCSLFEILRQKYGRFPASRSATKVEVARASHDLARILHIAPGDPLFYMTATILDQKDKPIFVGRQYFVASRFTFYF